MSTTKSRHELVEELNATVRLHGNLNILFAHAIATHVGLSAAEFECLSIIQDEGPMTAGELSRRCGITTGGMTGLIDRLERMGFAKRIHDSADRRRVLVVHQKKEAAKAQMMAFCAPFQRAFDELVATYTDEQVSFLLRHFKRITEIQHAASESMRNRQAGS